MSERTLFLAWQDQMSSRQWFPVGQLDVDIDHSHYSFRYIRGAERAQTEAGFLPAMDFPDLSKEYHSQELFPLFKNRIIAPRRPDTEEYLRGLGLTRADPVEILSVDGGNRVTDFFEVFPKIVKHVDGSFQCRFFLHGWRYINSMAQERINSLQPEEKLYITLELNNPATGVALQIQTLDYHMIGWTPRYLVNDLVAAMAEKPTEYSATVVQVNTLPEPSKQRLLIELSGNWNKHEPMSSEDFKPLANSNQSLNEPH